MSKYRLSFVTNSSSSSFVCEVCGNVDSGMDASASDLGFTECVNGHTFCEGHQLSPEITKEQLKKRLQEEIDDDLKYAKKHNNEYYRKRAEGEKETLSRVDQMTPEEVTSEYLALFDELPAEFCPICALDFVRDEDILMYFQKKTGVKTSDVTKEIQQKFGTLDDLKAYLKEETNDQT